MLDHKIFYYIGNSTITTLTYSTMGSEVSNEHSTAIIDTFFSLRDLKCARKKGLKG